MQIIIHTCQEVDIEYLEGSDLKPTALGSVSERVRPCKIRYKSKGVRAQVLPEIQKELTEFKYEGKVALQDYIYHNITGIAVTADNKLYYLSVITRIAMTADNKLLLCNHTNSRDS